MTPALCFRSQISGSSREARYGGPSVVVSPYARNMTLRPCLGFATPTNPYPRCPEYALDGESRCEGCKRQFEAWRRSQPHLTGRRGTSPEWARARGLALHRSKHPITLRPTCSRCGINDQELARRPKDNRLEVHHVDGDSENHRQSNLRVLCPPCHRVEQKRANPHPRHRVRRVVRDR